MKNVLIALGITLAATSGAFAAGTTAIDAQFLPQTTAASNPAAQIAQSDDANRFVNNGPRSMTVRRPSTDRLQHRSITPPLRLSVVACTCRSTRARALTKPNFPSLRGKQVSSVTPATVRMKRAASPPGLDGDRSPFRCWWGRDLVAPPSTFLEGTLASAVMKTLQNHDSS